MDESEEWREGGGWWRKERCRGVLGVGGGSLKERNLRISVEMKTNHGYKTKQRQQKKTLTVERKNGNKNLRKQLKVFSCVINGPKKRN